MLLYMLEYRNNLLNVAALVIRCHPIVQALDNFTGQSRLPSALADRMIDVLGYLFPGQGKSRNDTELSLES